MLGSLEQLRARIEEREAVVGVVGLGYVGLPVACLFAEVGFTVIGVDVKPDRVAQINAGVSPIAGNEPGLAEMLGRVVREGRLRATVTYAELARADAVSVNVETPVDEDHRPRYEALKAVCRSLGPVLKDGALVIVESTIAPGTTDGLVRPLLEESSGRKVGDSFYLGHCPERVMPGKLLSNLRSLSRVCGGMSPETSEVMVALYRQIVQAELDIADCVTAELVKTAENAYRDVNIAFANEVALICEAVGGDVWKVRELVNKSPGRNMLLPGAGVGGHCIPKDPWLLAYGAGDGVPVRLIPAARAVNDYMPLHVVDLVARALREVGTDLAGSRVAILGYSYLEDSDDIRNSPSGSLAARLRELGAEVAIHDPWVAGYGSDLDQTTRGCDAVVLVVAHSAYRSLDLTALASRLRTRVLVDACHIVDVAALKAGLVYRGIGTGNREAGAQYP